MKTNQIKTTIQSLAFLAFAFGLSSCNSGNSNNSSDGVIRQRSSGFQVDQLARPAINEGLSLNDSTLNALNSTPPNAQLSRGAEPVRNEIVGTLNAFAALGQKLGTTPAPTASVIAGAFLPDVMRIDTRLSIPPGTTAYNAATSGSLGMLTGGRKIEDDAMDITLSFLVAGDATGETVKDHVYYSGVVGNPNQTGHQLLHGQNGRHQAATFPFVTTPN